MAPFPKDFTWGAATSAYQIEGGHTAGGRGPSIWDAFAAIPGKTHRGEDGSQACDHYHRYLEDVGLMKAMGLEAYRFSLSWPRLFPNGRAEINREGVDFYGRLIDALLDGGITPWVTLYHWDLPLALQFEQDGWLNPEMPRYFAAYADACFEYFGDRVKHWLTLNEAWVTAILGYAHGIFAPGRVSTTEPYLVGHHLLLAHAAAVQVYRRKYQPLQRGLIGMANNCDWREPATERESDKAAAERALEFFLGWFADPLYTGDYPEIMRSRLSDRLPAFTDRETEALRGSVDFFGLNHYTAALAVHCDDPTGKTPIYLNGGIAEDQEIRLYNAPDWEQTAMGWSIAPCGCRKLLHWINARYGHPPIVITENGCAISEVAESGRVNDQRRIDFLAGYLAECRRAIDEGVDLRGYFVWSLLDNFEWALGYGKRFGIHHVDFATLKRTPKASAGWYGGVIRRNGLP
ncbi:MAG: GH1 family beta-glucosidase [Desulfosarcinaceae bacterium]